MADGIFISLEGIDGAGKTTLARGLQRSLAQRGIEAELMREPGGVATAEAIRDLVRDPSRTIGARTEALLFAAARAQLVEELLAPRLRAGALVLLDRFVDSSLVYQGVGRGLGIDAVAAVNRFATGGLSPDRTLLLELNPIDARARTGAREGAHPTDRIEREGEAFFAELADGYRRLAADAPERIRRLDAGRAPEQLLADALTAIDDLLP